MLEYTDLKILSERRHAIVIRGKEPAGRKVIIKIFFPSRLNNGSYRNEKRILHLLLRYPNIDFVQKLIGDERWTRDEVIRLLERASSNSYQHIEEASYFPTLVTSYCGRDIYYCLVRNTNGENYFTSNPKTIEKVARAVEHLATVQLPLLHHVTNIIHCDIKPENITYSIEEDKCYLIDFGSAILEGESSRNPWNERTLPYYSPKFETEKERDDYAIAMVLYFIAHQGIIPHEKEEKPLLSWNNPNCTTQIGYDFCSFNLFLVD